LLMVVFGAGASYDSCSTFTDALSRHSAHPWRPPLAAELFTHRFEDWIQRFPQFAPLVTNLQQYEGANVELFLEEMRETSRGDETTLKQLVAIRFYLQFMLSDCGNRWMNLTKEVSNYKTLINRIRLERKFKEKVCLVTFNQDTLVEYALSIVNVSLHKMSDYVSGDYPLFKLHGSVNWGRVVSTYLSVKPELGSLAIAREVIDKSSNLELSQTYELFWGDPPGLSATPLPSERPALFSAIAIPMQNKDEYECPQEHQQILEKMLPQVSKVLIVGWRAAENRFLHSLKSSLNVDSEFLVVGRDRESATKIIDTIGKAGVPAKRFLLANGGFTSAIRTGEIDRFLAA